MCPRSRAGAGSDVSHSTAVGEGMWDSGCLRIQVGLESSREDRGFDSHERGIHGQGARQGSRP